MFIHIYMNILIYNKRGDNVQLKTKYIQIDKLTKIKNERQLRVWEKEK